MTHALAAAAVLREIVSRLGESLPEELKAPPVDAKVARLSGVVTLEHKASPHPDLAVALVKARIVEDDLPTETLMQIWTAMRTDYRLSTPYVVHGLILSS